MKHLVGQSLGRYKIVSVLGEGGMGAVLKGYDATLQREVALKVMHPHIGRQTGFQQRFLQEARTVARLDHPGIISAIDFGQEGELLYLVMKFVPGDNLGKLLETLRQQRRWLPLPEALELVRQVSLALDYAHQQGVLHRDIKPDNIMLENKAGESLPYHPVITDFGLGKLQEGLSITQAGTSMGTPAYMSPEQATGQSTTAQSDIYSVGILLYELAVGQRPFPISTMSQAIHYHTQQQPPPPRSLRPDLPPALEQVILKAMAKVPSARFEHGRTLAEALAGVIPQATTVMTPPRTAVEGMVSLVTQLQHSVVQGRGVSMMEEFPQTLDEPGQDHLVVMDDKRQTQTISLKASFTIGRQPGNDLTLDDNKISRKHVQIEFDGNNYKVTDLNSSNGTYLGPTKLLPGMPQVWSPDQPLRVGRHWLRLQRRQSSQKSHLSQTFMTRMDGTMVEPGLVQTSAGEERVAAFMEQASLILDPGQSLTTSQIIRNQGAVVDHFKISVEGLPAEWLPALPQPVRLLPGMQQEIKLTLQPPRSSQSLAKNYPFTIQIASQDAPEQVARVEAALTITPYYQFSSELYPQHLRSGKRARVTIQNRGNSSQSYKLSWQDRADELVFSPPQAEVTVEPGGEGTVEFEARPRRRRWFGGGQTHPLTVQVKSTYGETQSHTGQLASQARLPGWLATLFFFLLTAGLLGGGGVLLAGPGWWVTPTPASSPTFTPTPGDEPDDVAAAGQAATATAVWEPEDDDRDGLSNKEEIALDTRPDKRDTDEDGLDDGEEVNKWQTDPLEPDHDGDGLKDGLEVRQGIDPLEQDTDGDGTPDAKDADPGQVPSPTPNWTATAIAARGTATAVWEAGDDDGDGLTNKRELALGSNPQQFDTDKDGLSDKKEVDSDFDPTDPGDPPPPTSPETDDPKTDKDSPVTEDPSPPNNPDSPTDTEDDNTNNPQPNNSVPTLAWVAIPAGDFIMGSDDADIQVAVEICNESEGNCQAAWFATEKPKRTEYVNGFQIAQFETTNAQYNACVNAGVCQPARTNINEGITYQASFANANHPVVGVSWNDAQTFCAWLGARLPNEKEWEKAARGTAGRLYPWGDGYHGSMKSPPNIGDTSRGLTQPVGENSGSGYTPEGVADMGGNAFEWTASSDGGNYVLRGGSWNNDVFRARGADRGTKLAASFANYDIGFRCAK
jgi:serine/threonine protein kinase/formylglycine-generating enzyme required for sulfatase activity